MTRGEDGAPARAAGKFPVIRRFVFAVFIWGKVGQICLAMSFYPHFRNQSCVMFQEILISKWPCESNIRSISNIYFNLVKICK